MHCSEHLHRVVLLSYCLIRNRIIILEIIKMFTKALSLIAHKHSHAQKIVLVIQQHIC